MNIILSKTLANNYKIDIIKKLDRLAKSRCRYNRVLLTFDTIKSVYILKILINKKVEIIEIPAEIIYLFHVTDFIKKESKKRGIIYSFVG